MLETILNTDGWIFWMWFAIYWSILGVLFDMFTKNFGWDKGYKTQTETMVQATKFLQKLAKRRGYKRIAKQALQAIKEASESEQPSQ
jgi:hypothetical protein